MAEQANAASVTETVHEQRQNEPAAETAAGAPPAQQQQQAGGEEESAPVLTLRLRPRPSVTWSADVINNEGMGKKSSKRECAGGGRPGGKGRVNTIEPDPVAGSPAA